MALTFDASSTKDGSQTNSITWSHTVGTGPNRLLVVTIAFSTNGTFFTSVTWNGTNLTKATSGGTGAAASEIWFLLNPASGTANIVATTGGGSTGPRACAGISFFNARQANPIGNSTNATSTSASLATPIPGFVGDMVISVVAGGTGTLTLTDASSQTTVQNGSFVGTTTTMIAAVGYKAGGVTDTLTWTLGASAAWAESTLRIYQYQPSAGFQIAP